MLTPEEIDAIRKRVEDATPGPWADFTVEDFYIDLGGGAWNPRSCKKAIQHATEEDLELCQHARTDIPRLLAEIDRLRARVEELETEVEDAEEKWF